MYFCHNALSFCLIHMKSMPKCSLFNSLSSDMVTNVVLAKACVLPSARSSYFKSITLLKLTNTEYITSLINLKTVKANKQYITFTFNIQRLLRTNHWDKSGNDKVYNT